MSNAFVGDATSVARDIRDFANETQADEVMLTVRVPGHDARVSALAGFRAAWDQLH
jgi:hypothetical protein